MSDRVQIFVRHCLFSDVSAHKERFPGFSREKCHQNLLATTDWNRAEITYLLDTAKGARENHFLKEPVISIQAGTEALSFLALLDHVLSLNLDPETILYFLEDDYLHRPGWTSILFEAFQIPGVDYVTLYDHRDKYFLPMYQKLESRLFVTPSCHWRSIPSTTQTFAMRYKTLLRDLKYHRRYSAKKPISEDHKKFCKLTRRGALLVSPIPGWSTHAEPAYASPCYDWNLNLSE
jgi:hypothetical protein